MSETQELETPKYIEFSVPNTVEMKSYKWPERNPPEGQWLSYVVIEFCLLVFGGFFITNKVAGEQPITIGLIPIAIALAISALTALFISKKLKQSFKKNTLQMNTDLKFILEKILENGWKLNESTAESFVRNRDGYFVNESGVEYRFKNLYAGSDGISGTFELIDEKSIAEIEMRKDSEYADYLYTMWKIKHGSMTDVELERFKEIVALAVDNISEIR